MCRMVRPLLISLDIRRCARQVAIIDTQLDIMTRDPAFSLRRREDHAHLTGQGVYAADAPLDRPLQIAFLRSPEAGIRLATVDGADAAIRPGVQGVYTARDVSELGRLSINAVIPLHEAPDYPILAGGVVPAAGQPIAAVVADTLAQAMDAAEIMVADGTPVSTPTRDIAGQDWQAGEIDAAFARAAYVVEAEVVHARLAPSPMEPRGVSVRYDAATDGVTIWHSTQTPHRTRSELANILNVAPGRIRVIAQHVGGAFGMKASLYPEEVFAVWAAFRHRRDTQWIATRSDDFLSALHGRGITSKGALAVDADGRFLALRADVTAPLGPWLPNSALVPAWNAGRILPSGYDVPSVQISTRGVSTDLGPTGIYRGAGRPEANCLMERLVDKAARAVGMDPFAIRQKNLLPSSAMPHRTPTGALLDSGDYAGGLARLQKTAGYQTLRRLRDQRRDAGELVGIGVAFYVEPSGEGWETARVTLQQDGRVLVASGSSSQGHARETAYARIAANALGLTPQHIDVVLGDTKTAPTGIGALASRSTAIGGSAVLQACLQAKARQQQGAELPITAEVRYENEGQAWGHGAYLVMLSVCPDTGAATIEQATCLDDTGTIIDAALVKGQILGGFAQGFGEAMMEQVVHDADGQLLTGSFMDYAMPRAIDVPTLDINTTETPSPMNLLGAKGVGEAGTIGAPAAILNAAIDALSPMGVTDLQMPLTPYRLWQAMKDASKP